MHDQLIAAIVAETAPVLLGQTLGKVWQLARATFVYDFRLRHNRYLLVAAEPNAPRLYLVHRTVRELEQQAQTNDPFLLMLRKQLSGARLVALTKDDGDRIVRFKFAVRDVVGAEHEQTLVAQLTGRAANLFLLDAAGRIVTALRPARGVGQEAGAPYQPPPRSAGATERESAPPFAIASFATLSDAADAHYQQLEATRAFDARATALATRLRQEITRREKLQRNLERDLAAHGDADEHKRIGDLLLANVATAERVGSRVRLHDYYTEGTPVIELELDEQTTLPAEAQRCFARYAKAKRAAQETGARLTALQRELDELEARRHTLSQIIAARDAAALEAFAALFDQRAARQGNATTAQPAPQTKGRQPRGGKEIETNKVARLYRSSDGYEILVGRGARENEQLTFRLARPHDLWLHAADYPGSHVVVRNPQRTELPQRTVIEAAQLAAYYSQAKQDAKVAVHYTQRKFVAKPKGAAPGLVRIASFRTMLVAPRESGERV